MALDSHESVSGIGTSGEFKKLPRSLSSWREQAVGLSTMLQWGLIFRTGPKTRQNHLCSRRGDERTGHDKPRRLGCFQVPIITAKRTGRKAPQERASDTVSSYPPTSLSQCPRNASWKAGQCPHVCSPGTFLKREKIPFVLAVFSRPSFQVGAEVEWVSELPETRGLDTMTTKGSHQQRDLEKENKQRPKKQKIQEAVSGRS